MSLGASCLVRRATDSEMVAAGRLLHDFNREFAESTPPPEILADRLRQLLTLEKTV